MDAVSFYSEKADHYTAALASCKKKILLLSLARLLTFIAFCVGLYYWLQTSTTTAIVVTLVSAAAFVITLRIALSLSDRKKLLEKLLFVCQNEQAVLSHNPNAFADGKSYLRAEDYSGDLDIFGSFSIFHWLNRCCTQHGTDQLAQLLRHPLMHPTDIIDRQKAVASFAEQPLLRLQIVAHGLLHKDEDGNLISVMEWAKTGLALHKHKVLQLLRWLFPVYTIPAFLYYIDTGNLLYFGIGLAAGWLLTARYSKYIYKQHQLLSKKQEILQQYANILRLFGTVNPSASSVLTTYKQTANEAFSAIGQLSKLAGMFDQRLNLVVSLILNSLLLYDIQCILMLDKWKARYSPAFPAWLHTVGDIECLNALATLAYNNPSFQYPVPEESDTLHLQVEQLAHPLIAAGDRIANSLGAGNPERILLITGSNMSGKTTFLRTLGVNMLLAQCGAPVCAKAFYFTPMRIFTSIRVSDSLEEHTSYFMAELKRLKHIITELKQQVPALVLIDEILRGTNSEDKTHGSASFIKQLIQYNCITLFATHDLVLAALENEHSGIVGNYCFESVISDNQLYFDYTLQKGVAKNKNASFLMKQMGIIED